MKIKSILLSMFVLGALVSCNSENEGVVAPDLGGDKAYVSLKVITPYGTQTRSTEQGATPEESKIHKLYAIAFDVSNNIITYGTSIPAAQLISNTGTEEKPGSFLVSSNAKGLLLVANPGPKLEAALTSAEKGMHYNIINGAIVDADVSEIIDNAANTKGYTMVNSGIKLAENDTDPIHSASLALVDISGKMKIVGTESGQFPTESDAKAEAEKDENRVKVGIERLAAKISVTPKSPEVTTPDDAKFTFVGWALDATNTRFFPYAKKIKTGTTLSGAYYKENFYTVDPNFNGHTGIAYNKILDFVPSIPGATDPVTQALPWFDGTHQEYVIENTMKANLQLYKNATRVIIKATYYPDETWTGDWFQYAGVDYKNLDELQDAYEDGSSINLRSACDKFFEKIKGLVTATKFEDLTQIELDGIADGGERVKEDGCVRWYQKGLNYYWYEMRHDAGITGNMAFAKYGVVRNNIYELTLNSVSKEGTPWYPSVDPDGGEKDPKPTDPIDDMEGYIGVTVEVSPWIKWVYNIDV